MLPLGNVLSCVHGKEMTQTCYISKAVGITLTYLLFKYRLSKILPITFKRYDLKLILAL